MKKFFKFGMLILLMALPAALFARTAVITDADLQEITAEAGVNIDFNNVTARNTTITSISWGDPSGFTPGFTNAGYFGFENISITGNLQVMNGTMKLDVGSNGTETKVFITLPTITLGTANISADLVVGRTADFSVGKQLGGTLTLRGFKTEMTGSLAVYAHD